MADNMSLADIAAVTDNDDNFGGGAWWIILLFLCLFGGGWNRNGNGGDGAVNEAGLCNAMNFNNLENAVGRMGDQMDSQNMMLSQGMSQLGYQAAQMNAETNANITAQTQKILDRMCANETQALRDRVAQLELEQAMAGVVRFPNATTYQAGPNPFFNPACNCGNVAF